MMGKMKEDQSKVSHRLFMHYLPTLHSVAFEFSPHILLLDKRKMKNSKHGDKIRK